MHAINVNRNENARSEISSELLTHLHADESECCVPLLKFRIEFRKTAKVDATMFI